MEDRHDHRKIWLNPGRYLFIHASDLSDKQKLAIKQTTSKNISPDVLGFIPIKHFIFKAWTPRNVLF